MDYAKKQQAYFNPAIYLLQGHTASGPVLKEQTELRTMNLPLQGLTVLAASALIVSTRYHSESRSD